MSLPKFTDAYVGIPPPPEFNPVTERTPVRVAASLSCLFDDQINNLKNLKCNSWRPNVYDEEQTMPVKRLFTFEHAASHCCLSVTFSAFNSWIV